MLAIAETISVFGSPAESVGEQSAVQERGKTVLGGSSLLARFRRLHAGDRGLIAAPWTPLASLCCRRRELTQAQKRADSPTRTRAEGEDRNLGQPSAKMELYSFIETGSAPGCVSRRSSI